MDQYNALGTLTSQSDQYSSSSRTYDNWLNWTSTTDANDNTTDHVFNQVGQPEVVEDALDGVTRMEYDDLNHLVAITDALTNTTRYEYDGNLLVIVTDTLTGTVVYSYTDGLLTQVVNHGITTIYGYDEFGQRTAVTDTLGNVTRYEYDDVGRLITSTAPNRLMTVNEYDDGDNLIQVTRNYTTTTDEPNYLGIYNLITEYEYNKVGNRTHITDTQGHVNRSWYDEANRLIASTSNYTTTTTGHGPGNDWNVTTTYGYNSVGHLITTTVLPGTPLEQISVNEYNALGNLVRVTRNYTTTTDERNYLDTYNLVTEYEYDAVGNQTHVTDTVGHVTRSWYDELNRLIRMQEAGGRITTYGYDAVGNQTHVTDTLSHVTLTEYDELNRPITVTTNYKDGEYNSDHPDQDLINVTVYDEETGRVSERQDAGGRITTYAYDELGRTVKVTTNYTGTGVYSTTHPDQNLITLTIYDDETGQVKARVQAASSRITTTYEYDLLGRLVTTTR